jgi:hypothetical protein
MKTAYRVLITLILLVCLSGCSQSSDGAETNPLAGKIYMHNTPLEQTFDFDYVKFYDDNTFQGVKVAYKKNLFNGENEPKYTNFYGSYFLDQSALTLNLSDQSYSGVVIDDGTSIVFGNDEFIDSTNSNFSDSFLSEFR